MMVGVLCLHVCLSMALCLLGVSAFDEALFSHPDLVGVKFNSHAKTAMTLHLFNDSAETGAVCLDGTPAGFYFSPATDSAHINDWQIYFQGGGWCYSVGDCWGRSKTALGSSSSWGSSIEADGIMSDDPTVNPDFAPFNRVYIPYCDGNSFSGNRDDAVVYNGTSLYFRGRRIIDSVFEHLLPLGLANATNVLLTGCSAGGLATYLHADYVGQIVQSVAPNVQRYKATSISGFFLLHNTVLNQPVYPSEMQVIFALANSTNGLNEACIASKAPADQWMCNFAPETYPYIATPFMPLNSALDSWQTGCILTSEYVAPNSTQNGACGAVPGWGSCSGDVDDCTSTQMQTMVQYESDFMLAMNTSSTFTKAGNGAFIYSCHTHCAAQTSYYNTYTINGVTMQQAVSKWWNSDENTPAAENTYTPCFYHTTAPYNCNPTCPQ